MNRVNPLQIGALLVVVIMFLFFKLSSLKDEMRELKTSYKESEKLAVELSSLKSVYADKRKIKNALNRILSRPSLKTANLAIKREKSSMKISSHSMDSNALNSLMAKILNGSYNITTLNIKKLSSTKVSLVMEIKW